VSEGLLSQLGGDAYLSDLDTKKQEGLQKSKAKKRWYDQEELLHQAFNNVYALDNQRRRELAEQMALPIEIVQGYEAHCYLQQKVPDLKVVEEILRSCFQEGSARAKKLYAIYLPEFDAAFKTHQKSRLKQDAKKGLWTLFLESLQNAIHPARSN
jgi:hypothetical protein